MREAENDKLHVWITGDTEESLDKVVMAHIVMACNSYGPMCGSRARPMRAWPR